MSLYKRGKVWWVRFQFRGQPIRRSTYETSRAEAEKFEERLRAQYRRIARGERPRLTYDTAASKFINEYFVAQGLKESSQVRYLNSIKVMTPHFTGKALEDIAKPCILDFINARLREVTPSTVRKDLACLSSIFSYMEECDYLETNIVPRIMRKNLKAPKHRIRYLSPDDYQRLLIELAVYVRPMFILAVETGMRQDELLGLEWSDIDVARKEARLTKTKTDSPRTVPLSDKALAQISSQTRRLRCPYVFATDDGLRYGINTKGRVSFRKTWMTALKNANIEDFCWHDLRHTFASWALKGWHSWQDRPMKIERLQEWLGHSTVVQTRKYAHLCVDDLHAEMSSTKAVTGTREQKRKKSPERRGNAK